jgi:hypothetical protein
MGGGLMAMSDAEYKRIVDAHRRGGGDARDELIEVQREIAATHRETAAAHRKTIASLESTARHHDEARIMWERVAKVRAEATARLEAMTQAVRESTQQMRESISEVRAMSKRLRGEAPDGPPAPSV